MTEKELAIYYYPIRCEGQTAGLAVSLGSRFLFFTADARFKHLDGERFSDLATLRAVVEADWQPMGPNKQAA